VDHAARIAYLKSLPREEAARILRAERVATQMKQYQKTGTISGLAMLTYGSDKVFDHSVRSLGVSFVTAYLAPAQENRNVATALAHCSYPDHTDAQTAAILMANLLPKHVAATATQLNVTTDQVEVALIAGIIELLDTGQLAMLSVLELVLVVGVTATRGLRDKRI